MSPRVDVTIEGVTDLTIVDAIEAAVRRTLAGLDSPHRCTVAVTPRSTKGDWTVGVVLRTTDDFRALTFRLRDADPETEAFEDTFARVLDAEAPADARRGLGLRVGNPPPVRR